MRMKRKTTIIAVTAGLLIFGLGIGQGLGDHGWAHKLGVALLGPPAVAMSESHTDPPASTTATFNHEAFDAILKKHVDADGWVDYKALQDDAELLGDYIHDLAAAPFDQLSRDDKLALLINAYNAFTLQLILDHAPVKSIRDIPDGERWDAVRWELAGKTYSLNQIEHELVRPNFKEPRIHFALVCAAYSCPKLRNEAFTGEQLEQQLADQTTYTHTHDRWYKFDADNNTLHLTALYDWYGGDFTAVADSVLDYVAGLEPEVRAAIDAGREPKVRWLDYDWQLNDVSNKP